MVIYKSHAMEASIKCELGFVPHFTIFVLAYSLVLYYEARLLILIYMENGMLQICDMVTIARHLNLTLVVPELDKRSFWADPRYNFPCNICFNKINIVYI
jgi:hypothetical protein